MRVCYKHVAPLVLNAAQFAARYPSWGAVLLARRVGELNPYGSNFACSRSNFRASPVHLSPLWGFRYLVYCVCYKPVAPLGLNAAQFAARYPSWGEVLLARRVGEPNPYGSNFACSRSNFRASLFTCRPSGALGYLVYAACYKHVAPLGLNAAQFAARYPSWGEFSSPSGLGNATPTDPTSRAHVPIFVPPGLPVAPLGL